MWLPGIHRLQTKSSVPGKLSRRPKRVPTAHSVQMQCYAWVSESRDTESLRTSASYLPALTTSNQSPSLGVENRKVSDATTGTVGLCSPVRGLTHDTAGDCGISVEMRLTYRSSGT